MANQNMSSESRRRDLSRSVFHRPLMSLQNEVDRLFGDFLQNFDVANVSGSGGALVPKADFSESEKGYELVLEVPGVAEKDLDVGIKNGVMTIRGEKKNETEEKNKDFVRIERSYGSYYRAMTLPQDADEEKISAHYANGVLRIAIPKSAEAKSKQHKIDIQQG